MADRQEAPHPPISPVKPSPPMAAIDSAEEISSPPSPSSRPDNGPPPPPELPPFSRETANTGRTLALAEAPAVSGSPSNELNADTNRLKLREIYTRSLSKFAGIDSYVARFIRREVVNGNRQPEDTLLMRYRKQPFSVYFKWLEGSSKEGREILYVRGQYNNQIQTLTGKRDIIAGMRVAIDLHSPRATANSRRTVDEAGIGNMIARFGATLDAFENGSSTLGTLQYLGIQQRPESPAPMECVLQQVPPGVEKHLPRGGRRFWFFNADPQAPEIGLPVVVLTEDENRQEVEYYAHDRFNFNVCRPEDFDPDFLWSKRSGR